MKGTYHPMGLYTIDMYSELPPSKAPESKYPNMQIKMEYDKAKKLLMRQQLDERSFDPEQYMRENKDIQLLLSKWNEDFQAAFRAAFSSYIKGHWSEAKQLFESCLKTIPDDGPTKALLEFMGEHNFQKPEDWAGWRHFAE